MRGESADRNAPFFSADTTATRGGGGAGAHRRVAPHGHAHGGKSQRRLQRSCPHPGPSPHLMRPNSGCISLQGAASASALPLSAGPGCRRQQHRGHHHGLAERYDTADARQADVSTTGRSACWFKREGRGREVPAAGARKNRLPARVLHARCVLSKTHSNQCADLLLQRTRAYTGSDTVPHLLPEPGVPRNRPRSPPWWGAG